MMMMMMMMMVMMMGLWPNRSGGDGWVPATRDVQWSMFNNVHHDGPTAIRPSWKVNQRTCEPKTNELGEAPSRNRHSKTVRTADRLNPIRTVE
jgi:hypothetical protein